MSHPVSRRFRPACAALVLLALAACTPAGGDPGGSPTPSAGPVSSTTTTTSGDPLRDRLSAGLESTSPASADVVRDPATKLTVATTDWLKGWKVVDVFNQTPPHGQRFYVALSDPGEVRYLSGEPDTFAATVGGAGVSVADATTATAIGELALDATRAFEHYAYRISDVDEIDWLPQATAAERRARQLVVAEHGGDITAPRPRRTDAGWALTLWMVDGVDLVRHDFAITETGGITDVSRTVARKLPVPESV